jgi:hypothetical protein
LRLARRNDLEGDSMGRLERRRSAAAIATTAAVALVAGALLVVTGTSVVSAYTVAGAIFVPDHGAPGAAIVVEGLPLAVDCPAVDVWLARGAAPSPPITAIGDPRLLKLAGSVRIRPIGAGGVNDTRPGTTFEFKVPAIEPGIYATYHRCRGGSPGFGMFGRGITSFTVDLAPPGTDTAGPLREIAAPPSPLPILAGVLAFPLFMLALARRRHRR